MSSIESPPTRDGSRALVFVLAALVALTLISWAASTVALGRAGIVVALAIAAVKGALVVYWFMELPLAATPARIVGVVTIVFIAILCAGTVADLGLR